MSKKKSIEMSKSAFIRSLPNDAPAKNVVAKALAAGIKISPNFVHTIRSNDRVKNRARRSPGPLARAAQRRIIDRAKVKNSDRVAEQQIIAATMPDGPSGKILRRVLGGHDVTEGAIDDALVAVIAEAGLARVRAAIGRVEKLFA